MLKISNELMFLFLNIRAYVSFKIKCIFAFLLFGHIFRKINMQNYKKKNKKYKIQFGSTDQLDGFFNSQIIGKNPINICKKLPFESNSITTIFSTHVIEHLHRSEIIFFLKDTCRVLKIGGTNIISTPSISKIANILYAENRLNDKNILLTRQKKWSSDNLNSCDYINGIFRNYGHRFILDFDFIKFHALKAGYKNITEVSVENIPDKTIKEFITKKRSDVAWQLETGIFLLTK